MMRRLLAIIIAASCLLAATNPALTIGYDRKYLVVLRDGRAVGLCSGEASRVMGRRPVTAPALAVRIDGDKATFKEETGLVTMGTGCKSIAPSPIPRGTILVVDKLRSYGSDHFSIEAVTEPREGTLPGNDGKKEIGEPGIIRLIFTGKSPGVIMSAVEQWMRPFDSAREAREFSLTLAK